MRIVQTFWTAGRNPLEHSFGWPRPEYNLMAWALSCLSIREHYDEVALYTDALGKHVLIDLLHLPYTEVHVVYDETLCLPQHWAYAKIKTYAMQTKPFLHIDGDIFLPHPLPDEVCKAPLVAQNKEIGTIYYKRMMDRILQEPAIRLPQYIEDGLRQESISSYNMGIFGGSDLTFIREYCREVFDFMERNRMNDDTCRQSHIDSNVFFEQVIFGVLADLQGRDVAGVMGKAIRDEGYTRHEFCNFKAYEDCRLLHLLGGHKRNEYVTYAFAKFMLCRYPDYARRVLELVCPRNIHTCLSVGCKPLNGTLYRLVPDLFHFVGNKLLRDRQISADVLFSEGVRKASDLPFRDEHAEQNVLLRCAIGLSVYELPRQLSESEMTELRKQLQCEPHFPLTHIAVLPSLRQDMLEVVALEATGVKITERMSEGAMSTCQLQSWILDNICHVEGAASEALKTFALLHIRYLVNTGILNIRENTTKI